jgi:CRP/FNR family cyclic AMP-dependent transcriptional regulator
MQKFLPTFWPIHSDTHEFLAQAGNGRSTIDYEKNQEIFCQGTPAHSVFFIQRGKVKITVTSSQGKEAIVGIMEEGQFFGEGCLIGRTTRTYTANALVDCRITSISQAAMLAALRELPNFTEMFMNHLLNRNVRIEEDVIDQLFNSSEKRLARALLLLANYGKEGDLSITPINLSQETLADMIGTTRSRVSFFMNKFRKLGFVSYNGKIEVHQSLLNAVLRDTPQIRSDDLE